MPLPDEILLAGRRLAHPVSVTDATRDHDGRSQALLIKHVGMIEPSPENRGRLAIVLRRAQDHDGIDGLLLILTTRRHHSQEGEQVHDGREEPRGPVRGDGGRG